MFNIDKTEYYAKKLEKIIKDAWEDQKVRVGIDGNNIIFKNDSGEKYIVNCDTYLDSELKVDADSAVSPHSVYFHRDGGVAATCKCGNNIGLEQDICPQCNRRIDWGIYKMQNK